MEGRVFFKMPFRSCPSGCGRFLSADDGHERCLQCLGLQHTEDAFVDDSCACCVRMSMTSIRSSLSFLKGLAPSAATRTGISGSSRGPPAGTLGDLRVTVRASPPGTSSALLAALLLTPRQDLPQSPGVCSTAPSLGQSISVSPHVTSLRAGCGLRSTLLQKARFPVATAKL